MAHFAEVRSGKVARVIVISNEDILNSEGEEVEDIGVAICKRVAGDGNWVQTSFHSNFRRHYAGQYPDMTYSPEHDAFLFPRPYASWVLDLSQDQDWAAPIPMPTDEGYWFQWDEQGQQWTAHEIPEQP